MAESDRQWYYTRSGVTHGPFALEDVRGMVGRRLLGASSYVWDGSRGGDWRTVSSCPELADALAGAVADARRQGPPSAVPGDAEGADEPGQSWDGALSGPGERPRMALVVARSWRWMTSALFGPFRFAQWAGIAFCSWMALVYPAIRVFDEKTFVAELQGGAPFAAAALVSVRGWASGLLSGRGAAAWCAAAVFYVVAACFIRAKGRLMLLHRLRFPGDSVRAAWAATAGRTLPLALFHAAVDSLFVAAEVAAALRIFPSLRDDALRSGSFVAVVRVVLADAASRRWLWLAVAAFLVAAAVRSVAWHFIEPLFYRLRVPLRSACLIFRDLLVTELPAVLSFYLRLLAFRLAVLSAGLVMLAVFAAVAGPFLAALPLALPYLVRLVFLPADYFMRALGPRFLSAWKGLW